MRPLATLREALTDESLLGLALPGDSWLPWRTVMLAAMGEPLTDEELAIYQQLSGRQQAPTGRCEEVAGVVGRRGGKSRALSVLTVYVAALCDHSDVLVPGERGVALLLGPDQRQAAVDLSYCTAILQQSHQLASLIVNETQDTIELANGIDIEIRAASFKRVRGLTAVSVMVDEAAYLPSEGAASSDTELLTALRPMLATTKGPLIIASSPYRKAGEFYSTFTKHYAQEGDPILVLKGTTQEFNPAIDPRVIERALERDPVAARSEYLAEWRDDIDSYVTRDVVESCVDSGARERPFSSKHRYFAAVDPAGGSGTDSMTLAIGHKEGETVVLDAIVERRPPFSPDATVREFCAKLKSYHIHTVTGDRWAGEFVREPFRTLGIQYELSAKTKNEAYIDGLPKLNSGTIRLLDNERLTSQLISLERRHGRTGRDTIDHPPHGHDDISNVVVLLAAVAVARSPSGYGFYNPYTGILRPDCFAALTVEYADDATMRERHQVWQAEAASRNAEATAMLKARRA